MFPLRGEVLSEGGKGMTDMFMWVSFSPPATPHWKCMYCCSDMGDSNLLVIHYADLTDLKQVGKGANGEVYRASHKMLGSELAVKVFKVENESEEEALTEELRNEIELLRWCPLLVCVGVVLCPVALPRKCAVDDVVFPLSSCLPPNCGILNLGGCF